MIIVSSENTLAKLIIDLSQETGFITVDTEFIREVSQVPLLCLIQLATRRESYAIDPVSVDITKLKPFLADGKLVKVFHDAKQDIEILQSYGFEINNIYDTQLCEMLVSVKENISYQTIVLEYTHKKLKKRYGLSDWSKRPLSRKQLLYAIEDVTCLRKVYKKQRAKLKQLHREVWLEDESYMLESNSIESSLNESCYPFLYKLLAWREEKAKEQGVSVEQIAKDKMIKSICKKGKDYIKNLKHSRNLVGDRGFLDYAESIADEFSLDKMKAERNPIVDLLKTLLGIKAAQYQVAPIMIASVKDLFKFVSGDQSVRFLQGWRKEIFGNAALDLLNNKIQLGVQDNQVVLWDRTIKEESHG